MFKNTDCDYIKELGLENLDEKDKEIIVRIFSSNDEKNFIFSKKVTGGDITNSISNTASYTLDYLFLKQLLQIKEQNQKTIEQNEQIINLLTEIKNK